MAMVITTFSIKKAYSSAVLEAGTLELRLVDDPNGKGQGHSAL